MGLKNMSKKGLELLAPAGTLEVFKNVVAQGADAVYFGGNAFGARAYAGNLSFEESEEAISYAHLNGAKTYLTVNTLIKNREMDVLYEYLRRYYEMGVDGVLVQDLGVLKMVKDFFPNMAIHASTQLSTVSSYGSKFLLDQGVERVVAARELSLKELKHIYDTTGMEIEAFVHGALCVCYSGQCLMSSFLGGRSGNRGRCAQPCRLEYSVCDDNRTNVNQSGPYMLSPKDYCLIDYLPEMDEAGVYSFKIEGRMKSVEYASTVVSIYREVFDRYLSDGKENYKVTDREHELLLDAGSRNGFTSLYLTKKNGKEMMSFKDSSHEKNTLSIEKEIPKLPIEMSAYLKTGMPAQLSVFYKDVVVSVEGDMVEKAQKNPLEKTTVQKQLKKLGSTPFICSEPMITVSEDAFLGVKSLNELRRKAIDQLIYETSGVDGRHALPFKEAYTSDALYEKSKPRDIPSVYISIRTIEQMKAVLAYGLLGATYIIPFEALYDKDQWMPLLEKVKTIDSDSKLIFDLPEVLRKCTIDDLLNHGFKEIINAFDGFRAHSVDGLGLLDSFGISHERILLSSRVYTWSNLTIQHYRELGYVMNEIPVELTEKELMHRNNQQSILPVYGRTTLMIKADCTHQNVKGCDKKSEILYLNDRKDVDFPVWNRCSICMNYIYNSRPYSILDLIGENHLGVKGHLITFTLEDEREVKQVLYSYCNHTMDAIDEFTRGHYKKGVQ